MSPNHAPVRAVLFDLDGTLLDTVGELARAANRMLLSLGLAERGENEIRDFIGQGTPRLVERCLGVHSGRLDEALTIFNAAYVQESGRGTRIFPGVIEGINMLEADGLRLGCVTNKPGAFTMPLLQQMGLARYFDVVVSGDTVARKKPDHMPFTHACAQIGVSCPEALVVGDSANDAIGARAAGCRVLCVPYGYREGKPVESIECDAVVDDLRGAAEYVRRLNRTYSKEAG